MPPAFTENGWPSCGPDQLDRTPVPGTAGLVIPLQQGIPATIMRAFAADLNAYIESLNNSRGYTDEGGWTPTNSVATSNHLGGTAMDLNWSDHPMGIALDGWHGSDLIPGEQEPAVRELLAFYTYKGIQLIWWGNDWDSPKDSMHFQMGYGTYVNQDVCREFIARFIRADGFSTYRRGNSQPTVDSSAVDVLARATSLSADRAATILPAVTAGLRQSDCTSPARIAMWLAQVGHESGSFVYTEEIASGAAYEGRTDLGNTQPGDGVRFKGRTWIQITGRANYGSFSRWANGKGICPTPTYFVDNPTHLAEMQYAGVGAAWYWTVARPDINALCDAGDIVTVTKRINGGTNGLADRQARHQRAAALGDQLLALTTTPEPANPIEELLMSNLAVPSWSIYADPGEPPVPVVDMIRALDAHGPHEPYVEAQARAGDPDALRRVVRTAAGKGQYGAASGPVNQARAVLADIEKANPAVLQAFLNGAHA